TIATLEHFESGARSSRWTRGASVSPMSPQSTRMEFSFSEDGEPVNPFRIFHLSIADATGNEWLADVLSTRRPAWTTNGVVEFVGGLWQAEDAWKITMRALRSAGFSDADCWNVTSISIPAPKTQQPLPHHVQLGSLKVHLATIMAPGAYVTNSWRKVRRYWGKEPSVYTLGILLEGELGDKRPVIVEATDQNNRVAIPFPN